MPLRPEPTTKPSHHNHKPAPAFCTLQMSARTSQRAYQTNRNLPGPSHPFVSGCGPISFLPLLRTHATTQRARHTPDTQAIERLQEPDAMIKKPVSPRAPQITLPTSHAASRLHERLLRGLWCLPHPISTPADERNTTIHTTTRDMEIRQYYGRRISSLLVRWC